MFRSVLTRYFSELKLATRIFVVSLPKSVAVLAAGILLTVVALWFYAQSFGPWIFSLVEPLSSSVAGRTWMSVIAVIPLVIVALAVSVVWAGTVALLADGARSNRSVSSARAARVAVKRSGPAALVAISWAGAVAVALIITPLSVTLGLLGLIVFLVTPAERRPAKLPPLSTLLVLSIPLVLPATIAVRWSLALAAVWVDGRGAREALRLSWSATRGRYWNVAMLLLTATGVFGLLTWAAGTVGASLDPTGTGEMLAGLLMQVLLGAVPVVALITLYRRTPAGGTATSAFVVPRSGARVGKVAGAMAVLLVAQVVLVGTSALPASAADRDTPRMGIWTSEVAPFDTGKAFNLQIEVVDESYGDVSQQPTGDITVVVDGNQLIGTFTLDYGYVEIPYPEGLPEGTHAVTATFPGDSIYSEQSASLTFDVGTPAQVTLADPSAAGSYGADLILTATVASTPSAAGGTVEFFATRGSDEPVSLGTSTVDDSGIAELTSSSLLPGTYTVLASYRGDSGGTAANSASVSVSVRPLWTETEMVLSPTTQLSSPSLPGGTVTATVSVSPLDETSLVARGTVELTLFPGGDELGTGALVDGRVELEMVLPPGQPTVQARFVGEAGFYPSTTEQSQFVATWPSAVSVTTPASGTVFGEDFDVIATVTAAPDATPTGDMEFYVTAPNEAAFLYGTATVDGDGAATMRMTGLAVGDYTVSATYVTDGTIGSASSPEVAHSVGQASVDVIVAVSDATPLFGSTVRATVTVTATEPGVGTPSGDVVISRDGTVLSMVTLGYNGSVQADLAVGDGGDHTYTAAYAGDASFPAASSTVDITVARKPVTVIMHGAADRSGVYGGDELYSGAVIPTPSGPSPTGTVALYADGYRVGTSELGENGTYSITTDTIPALPTGSETRVMIAKYLGDTNHTAAQSDGSVTTEMKRATSVPVLRISPGDVGVGGTYTLTATLDDLGNGAGGTVNFTTVSDGLIGTATVRDGVATIPYRVTDTLTYFSLDYSGDDNFFPTTAGPVRIDADRAAALVEISLPGADPEPFIFGAVVELVIKVELGDGSEPLGTVDLRTATNIVIAEDLPVTYFESLDYGLARVSVCVGTSAACVGGEPAIGLADQELVASYPASATSFAGESAPMAYSMSPTPTATTLGVTPATVSPGGGTSFTATVINTGSGIVPTGNVAFYGLTPTDFGMVEAFIGNAEVVDGVARFHTSVGTGAGELRWPATAVVARYFGGASYYVPSDDSVSVVIDRISTSLRVFVLPPTVDAAASVQVTLNHGPGVADDFTGQVTVTSDEGETCTVTMPAGASTVSCDFSWGTAGGHSVSAVYSGDDVYQPSASEVLPVTVSRGTLDLNVTVPYEVVAGASTEVTWRAGVASATGTVSVWAAGGLWCEVDIAVGRCSGVFTNTSATGSPAEVRVRYSGDANWEGLEDLKSVNVASCATLDVESRHPALGTVTVDTAPNCGVGGFLEGTVVTVTAHPIAPNEFAGWELLDGSSPDVVPGAQTLSTSFTVTDEWWTWMRVASFREPCYAVTPQITGSGYLYTSATPNCTVPGGGPGYTLGSTVTFTPTGLSNPDYGVPDIFYAFGTLPSGATVGRDVFDRPTVSQVVDAAVEIPATFGPSCLFVNATARPVDARAVADTLSTNNCTSPISTGFLPLSTVVLESSTDDPDLVLSAWEVDGEIVPALGSAAQATVSLATSDIAVTAVYTGCYAVTLVVDGAWQFNSGRSIGDAALDVEPNCPDGSARYREGTEITATPSLLVENAQFLGWDIDQQTYGSAVAGEGALPGSALTFVVTATDTHTAVFSLADLCSRLTVQDRNNLVTLDPSGCGPGQYQDSQKQFAAMNEQDPSELWMQRYRSTLSVTKNPGSELGVYASVRGDARYCFGNNLVSTGPNTTAGQWQSLGALGAGRLDCWVGGDINLRFEQCQALAPDVKIARFGDETGTLFGTRDLPDSVYVPSSAGNFIPMTMAEFDWVQAEPMYLLGGELVPDGLAPGPCNDAGNAFQAGLTLMMGADSISQGIVFQGWTSDAESPLVPENPVLMETDEATAVMQVSAAYEMTCHHVTFGEGITIVGEAPRCPGYSDAENMFIAGTGILVNAVQHIGGRTFGDWQSGVIAATSVTDPVSLERTAFAYVNADKTVAVKYPTEGERWEAGFANGGKVLAGIGAVALPIVVGIACPPCGIVLAVVGTVAAVTSLVPGGEDVTGFFDLVNPLKITECAARWGFGSGSGVDTEATGAQAGKKTATTVKKTLKYIKPAPTAAQAAKTAASNAAKVGTKTAAVKVAAKGGLQAAGFVYGLYSAGLFDVDLGSYQNVDQLRDTATMTTCLDGAWRFADSNTAG